MSRNQNSGNGIERGDRSSISNIKRIFIGGGIIIIIIISGFFGIRSAIADQHRFSGSASTSTFDGNEAEVAFDVSAKALGNGDASVFDLRKDAHRVQFSHAGFHFESFGFVPGAFSDFNTFTFNHFDSVNSGSFFDTVFLRNVDGVFGAKFASLGFGHFHFDRCFNTHTFRLGHAFSFVFPNHFADLEVSRHVPAQLDDREFNVGADQQHFTHFAPNTFAAAEASFFGLHRGSHTEHAKS